MSELKDKLRAKLKSLKENEGLQEGLKDRKNIFSKIKKSDGRKLYYTRTATDLYSFGVNKRNDSRFLIIFRRLFNRKKYDSLGLFKVKEGDEFKGIYHTL